MRSHNLSALALTFALFFAVFSMGAASPSNAKNRKTMVSSGDRSAKIRTYNYPQGRVTEHRINLTKYNLQSVINGEIQEFVDELQLAENAEKLKEGTANE